MRYTSSEEKRYLKNVDFSNATEAAAAIPFFAKRIKQIIQIIYRNRHQSKFQKIKHSLKGSSKGLEKMLFDQIIRFVSKESLSSLQFDLPRVEDVVNRCQIKFTYTYDLSQTYYDTHLLHTEGDELITPDGDMHIGYYNIVKNNNGEVLYFTGKKHTNESLQLTRVDHRVPLKSYVACVSYGRNRKVKWQDTYLPDGARIGLLY